MFCLCRKKCCENLHRMTADRTLDWYIARMFIVAVLLSLSYCMCITLCMDLVNMNLQRPYIHQDMFLVWQPYIALSQSSNLKIKTECTQNSRCSTSRDRLQTKESEDLRAFIYMCLNTSARRFNDTTSMSLTLGFKTKGFFCLRQKQ